MGLTKRIIVYEVQAVFCIFAGHQAVKRCDSERRRGLSDRSVGRAALRNCFLHSSVIAGKVYCLSAASFDFPS